MTDKKISAETAASALDGTEQVLLVQSGVNVKTTTQAIADLAPPPVGAGLLDFVEVLDEVSPNDTLPVAALLAIGPGSPAVDVDAAFVPKGDGSVLAAIPDSTTVGGNKRGAKAFDTQLVRSDPAMVASGAGAVIVGGQDNTASGVRAIVVGGYAGTAGADHSTVGGGAGNSIGGGADGAVIGGGQYNQVATSSAGNPVNATIGGGGSNGCLAPSATIAGGDHNIADGIASSIEGGSYGSTRRVRAARAFGAGFWASDSIPVAGSVQDREVLLWAETTTPVNPPFNQALELTADGITTDDSTTIVLPDNSCFAFEAMVMGYSTTNGAAAWTCSGVVTRGSGAGTIAFNDAADPTPALIGGFAPTGWNVACTVEATTGRIMFVASIPEDGDSSRWIAKVRLVEILALS